MKANKPLETGRQRWARTKALLAEQSDARSAALLHEANRCGKDWKDGRYTCEIPACPDCRRRNSERRCKEAVRLFGGFQNDDVAFMTVVAAASRDPGDVLHQLKKAQEATVDRRKSSARVSAAWGGTRMLGYLEVDAIAAFHLPHLAPKRASLLPELVPMSLDTDEPTYIATYHALFYLNGLDVAEVRNTFEKQWQIPGQVDVRPLRSYRTLEQNVRAIASYATKFSSVTELTLDRRGCKWLDPWPVKWDASLYSHLFATPMRNAFEFMRFSINFSPLKFHKSIPMDEFEVPSTSLEPMPLTCSSPREDMYNILYGRRGF